MTDDEFNILQFLRSSPKNSFTRKEIARKAVHRSVFEQNQHWVNAPLHSLVAKGHVEVTENGFYRINQNEDSR